MPLGHWNKQRNEKQNKNLITSSRKFKIMWLKVNWRAVVLKILNLTSSNGSQTKAPPKLNAIPFKSGLGLWLHARWGARTHTHIPSAFLFVVTIGGFRGSARTSLDFTLPYSKRASHFWPLHCCHIFDLHIHCCLQVWPLIMGDTINSDSLAVFPSYIYFSFLVCMLVNVAQAHVLSSTSWQH